MTDNPFDGDPTLNYHGGNQESTDAHDSIRAEKARLRARVVRYVERRGQRGATCDEIEVASGMSHQTISARCTEAKALGEVVDSGRRRPTRTGRNAAVLVTPSPPPAAVLAAPSQVTS